MTNDKVGVQELSPVAERILLVILDGAKLFTGKISNEYARKTVEQMLDSLKDIIRALADANPDDTAQIRGIIDKFLSETDFLDRTKQELLNEIEKLNDPRLVTVLSVLMPKAFDILQALFDENPANEQQIIEELKELIKGPEAINFLTGLLQFVIKDESTARTIASLIISLVGGVLMLEAEATV